MGTITGDKFYLKVTQYLGEDCMVWRLNGCTCLQCVIWVFFVILYLFSDP